MESGHARKTGDREAKKLAQVTARGTLIQKQKGLRCFFTQLPRQKLEPRLDPRRQKKVLADMTYYTTWVQTGLGSNVANLPFRYLPPGKVFHVWLDFETQDKRKC